MRKLKDELIDGALMVSDGAWGTFLQQKGLQAGECPELWCTERASDVREIPLSYIAAGAQMVKTNSFGASRIKLANFGLEKRVREINRAAASISREAAGDSRHVLASIGPTGKLLLMGEVTEEELFDVFSEQAVALEEGGADIALIETMSAIDEAAIAIKAVKQNTKLEVACTFTFEKTVQGDYRTMMGVTPEEMAKECLASGADLIGANCGNGFERMVEVVERLHTAAPEAYIIVHANAGMPYNKDGATIFPETPDAAAGFVPALVKAGAKVIGGCCGTTPQHIFAIAQMIKKIKKSH
jgi:5-methyltetrahydrofolate--homocysteine methyltransferase